MQSTTWSKGKQKSKGKGKGKEKLSDGSSSSESSQTTSSSATTDESGENSKRQKTDNVVASGSTTVGLAAPATATSASPSTVRALTSFTPQLHPDLPAGAVVRLKPVVELKNVQGVDRVNCLEISSGQRTPSPFGSRMGDHTTAWASVIDALHARVIDKPLPAAIQAVREAQQQAQAWMSGLLGGVLLNALEDRDQRVQRLADAAQQAADFLQAADTALGTEAKRQAFQSAIAQHLTFLNYLPFATVPAASERGSKGSGEGTMRGQIVAEEQRQIKRRDEGSSEGVVRLNSNEAKERCDDLWGMFDFEAALRASGAALILDPNAISKVEAMAKEIVELGDSLQGFLDNLQKKKNLYIAQLLREGIEGRALTVLKSKDAPQGIITAVTKIQTVCDWLRTNNNVLEVKRKVTINKREDDIGEQQQQITNAANEANVAVQAFINRVENLRISAPSVLAYLLHKHQQTMADAYTWTVRAANFLNPTASQTAVIRLKDAIHQILSTDETLSPLLTGVTTVYNSIIAILVPAQGTDWTRNAERLRDLVVDYNPRAEKPEDRLTVNGRASAPTGVAGLGSHITSWDTEVRALKQIVVSAHDDEDALTNLKAAVWGSLNSEVMTLDRYLPADQLWGHQLVHLFTAAQNTLTATKVGPAATAYLRFRNLLPFATVDAGRRGGGGEGSSKNAKIHIDRQSLRQAAGLQKEALNDLKRRPNARAALEAAAKELEEGDWKKDAEGDWEETLNARVTSSAERLKNLARRLDSATMPKDVLDVFEIIHKKREVEHTNVSKLAGDEPD